MGCVGSTNGDAALHDRYELGEKLGQGAFGQVRAVRAKEAAEGEGGALPPPLAVKAVSLCRKSSQSSARRKRLSKTEPELEAKARLEVAIWRAVGRHEHCVQLFEAFACKRVHYMVMERCRCTVLQELIDVAKGKQVRGEGDVAVIFRGMLLGVAHLHKAGIVHRDVKPDNFLLGGEHGRTVKICDFGLATILDPTSRLYGTCGTAPYMSPEMVSGEGYRHGTDIWSIGVCMYLLMYGDIPYVPVSRTPCLFAEACKHATLTGLPEPTFKRRKSESQPSPQASMCIRALLQRSPDRRCIAEEVLQMPFMMLTAPSKDVASPGPEDHSLARAIDHARQRTREFEAPVDPTVQRSLKELLVKSMSSAGIVQNFSNPQLSESTDLKPFRRPSTHCGTLSLLFEDDRVTATPDTWSDSCVSSFETGRSPKPEHSPAHSEVILSISPHALPQLPHAIPS